MQCNWNLEGVYIYIYISDFDIERYRVRWDSHIIVFSTLF